MLTLLLPLLLHPLLVRRRQVHFKLPHLNQRRIVVDFQGLRTIGTRLNRAFERMWRVVSSQSQ